MKITFLKSMLLAVVFACGLSSCKKEVTEETATESETTVDNDTLTTTEVKVDESGAKDTIAVSTDTVLVKKHKE